MPDTFISVDVETSGAAPSTHALLSVGACLVDDPAAAFYVELQPTTLAADPAALAVSGLSLEALAERGVPPAEAMSRFAAWAREVTPPGHRPVFVAFNAAFDWMFVADYFHRFGVPNPFGHAALDIKALFMGATGEPWEGVRYATVASRVGLPSRLSHHALEDARTQAQLFRQLLAWLIPGKITAAARRQSHESRLHP